MVPPQLTTNALYLQTFPASLSLSGVHGAAHKNSVWGTAGEGGKGSVHLDERENGWLSYTLWHGVSLLGNFVVEEVSVDFFVSWGMDQIFSQYLEHWKSGTPCYGFGRHKSYCSFLWDLQHDVLISLDICGLALSFDIGIQCHIDKSKDKFKQPWRALRNN